MREIKKVAVAGGGNMGRQIALCIAIHGYETRLFDVKSEIFPEIQKWSDGYLEGRIKKGKLTEEQVAKAKANFIMVPTLEEAVKDVDLVVETIVELRDVKRDFFKQLDALIPEDVWVGSNSSMMGTSQFADCIKNPARLGNLHFSNPALAMEVVELVQGPHTADETMQVFVDFCKSIGKDPVWVKKEYDGFVLNSMLRAFQNQAFFLVENGYVDPHGVDTIAEKGLGHPMGPFRLMDLTGIDLSYFVRERKYQESGKKEPGYDLIKAQYETGNWGRKTGKGWYDYTK